MDSTNYQEKTRTPKDDDNEEEEEEEEEEEALSLRDFHLNSDEFEKKQSPKIQETRRSSSEPSDFFEFFNDLNYEMSHAEDIIYRGKLVPYKKRPLFDDHVYKTLSADQTRPKTIASERLMRSGSTSLDCKKLRRRRNPNLVLKSEASDIHRSFSKSSVKSDVSGLKVSSKPRWYVLLFGIVKFPPEIDLQDMKNRQVRRNVGSAFTGGGDGGRIPANRSDRRTSWSHDLLRVLSCKSHASVAVTASFGLVPQV